ncbi:MAG: hypothetical protein A2202_03230 [Bdellovibrionales bacterium RIFOXYA1_FULL_36_14]|nr:MAG: hypothetical protein A2202_03230 [Bdellovibrionales bacterium RIFOXYA1_FULL_36_14]
MKGLLKKQVVLAMLLAMTISGSASALVFNFPGSSGGVSSNAGLTSSNHTVAGVPQAAVNIAKETKCVDSRNYLSWDLLKTVANFENNPPRIEKIVTGDKVDIQIFIPTHIKECLDPQVEISTIEKPKKLGFFVKVRNRFFEKNPRIVNEIFGSEKEMNRLSQDARLTKCFENRFAKRIKVKEGVEVVDIVPDEDIESGRMVHLTTPVKVDDIDKVYAYMHSPYDGLTARKGTVANIHQEDSCFRAENFNMEDKEIPLYDSRMLADMINLEECSGQEDCIQRHVEKIFEIFQKDDIEKLSGAHIKYLEDILFVKDKIGNDNKEYKNIKNQMKDIVEKMRGLAENMLEEGAEDIKTLSREYDELRFKLETEYIEPLIIILEKRYKMRKEANPEEIKVIDDSIQQLNELIGMYADETGRADEVVVLLAAKGLSMNSKKASHLYLQSVYWSMVNHDGEERLKPEQAKREIAREGKKIEVKVKQAKVKYLVSTGKKTMSPVINAQMGAASRGYQAQMEQMYSREMELRKGCSPSPWGFGVLNQANCSKFYKGMNVRNQQRQIMEQNYNKNMSRLQNQASTWRKYEMLGARYTEAQRQAKYGNSMYSVGGGTSLIDFGTADSYLFDNPYGDASYDPMYNIMSQNSGLEFNMPQDQFGGGNYMNSPANQMLMQRQQGINGMYGGSNMNFGGNMNYGQGQMSYGQQW